MDTLTLTEGTTIDGVRLLRRLAKGNDGEVWMTMADNGTVTAIKIFYGKEETDDTSEYEMRMASQFTHDNILTHTRMSLHDSHPVLHMPYCEGRSTESVAGFFNEYMTWRLVKDMSGALTHIHDKGYAHGGIRPANILWDGQRFLLSGFGECGKCGGSSCHRAPSTGNAHRFRSPEADKVCSSAGDIWSLGATVFYLYMGCHVFNGLGGKAQHKDSPVPYMRKSMPALSILVQRCLSFDPLQRPSAKEITAIAEEALKERPSPAAGRKHRQAAGSDKIIVNEDFWPDAMIES